MSGVMSVLGRRELGELGHCQPHEHIFVRRTPAAESNAALEIADEAKSLQELTQYRVAGGGSIVDAQPLEAGRDMGALVRLSRGSGVMILSVTGYHLPVFYAPDHWMHTEETSCLRDRFLKELLEGVEVDMDGTRERVFPGAVKAAIGSEGPVGQAARRLQAAAAAAASAQVPLMLHTEYGKGAVEAVAVCEKMGLAPNRVAVCHVDRQAEDFAPHEAVARTGAFLEYDTIARAKYHTDAQECALIRHMLEAGYGDRLLLSLDTTAARLTAYGGKPGLDGLLRGFLPLLVSSGIRPEAVRAMTRENPRKLFA